METDCQVFKPSYDEFNNFNKFVNQLPVSAFKEGICKVIPPKEWIPRKNGYDLDGFIIKKPKKQKNMFQTNGCFRQTVNCIKNTCFKEYASTYAIKGQKTTSFRSIENKFWNEVNKHEPVYANDIDGSLFDKDLSIWNLNKLETFLNHISRDGGYNKISGVTSAYIYFGTWLSSFPWHKEDLDLYSVSYLHFGEDKTWYCIPYEEKEKFESLANELFCDDFKLCETFINHKFILIDPKILVKNKIKYKRVTQSKGEFIITFPGAYHSGFNHGINCSEAVNFANYNWIPKGVNSKICDSNCDFYLEWVNTLRNLLKNYTNFKTESENCQHFMVFLLRTIYLIAKKEYFIINDILKYIEKFFDFDYNRLQEWLNRLIESNLFVKKENNIKIDFIYLKEYSRIKIIRDYSWEILKEIINNINENQNKNMDLNENIEEIETERDTPSESIEHNVNIDAIEVERDTPSEGIDQNDNIEEMEAERETPSEIMDVSEYIEKIDTQVEDMQLIRESTKGLYKCLNCNKEFKLKKRFDEHILYHQLPQFKCKICKKDFHEYRKVKRHILQTHLKIRKFECKFCDDSFLRNEHLQNHTFRKHQNVKKYCSVDSIKYKKLKKINMI